MVARQPDAWQTKSENDMLGAGCGDDCLLVDRPAEWCCTSCRDAARRVRAAACGQYSIPISNGSIGLTIRFESEAEFATFLANGRTEPFDDHT